MMSTKKKEEKEATRQTVLLPVPAHSLTIQPTDESVEVALRKKRRGVSGKGERRQHTLKLPTVGQPISDDYRSEDVAMAQWESFARREKLALFLFFLFRLHCSRRPVPSSKVKKANGS